MNDCMNTYIVYIYGYLNITNWIDHEYTTTTNIDQIRDNRYKSYTKMYLGISNVCLYGNDNIKRGQFTGWIVFQRIRLIL
jgi:hypothetical protein